MKVRDLEIAMVLAREMNAAAARSVDASLRVEQLQEVFGAGELDQAERTRIQTALQMAGLEPRPSLLEAQPGDAIRFGLGDGAPAAAQEPAAEEPVQEEERPAELPTVGEFARSTFRRARRRFGAERRAEVNGNGHPIATAEAAGVEEDDHLATDPDHPVGPAAPVEEETTVDEPPLSFGGPPAPPDLGGAPPDPLDFDDPEYLEVLGEDLPALEDELLEETGDRRQETGELGLAPETGDRRPDTDEFELPEADELDLALDDEVPELTGAQPEAVLAELELELEPEPETETETEPEHLFPEPAAPVHGGVEELAAVLLPAVTLAVVATSIGGWRFGLPFVALSVVATGWLLRRSPDGPLAMVRRSPAGKTLLKTTLAVTAVSAVVAVVLASLGHGSGTATHKAATPPAKPKAAAPKRKPPVPKPKPARPQAKLPSTHPSKPAHKRPHRKPSNPTAGLVRVPPPAPKAQTTPPQPTAPQR